MRKLFLGLSPKQMGRVTSNIEDASLFWHGNGDHREWLRAIANRSAGNIKRIYIYLIELSDDEFKTFVDAMAE